METIKTKVKAVLIPVARGFSGFHPNTLTLIGFLVTCIAGFLYAKGIFWLGGVVLLIAGLFDTIDGEVARITGRTSTFGAFLDSCIDRYADFVVLFGMFLWYSGRDTIGHLSVSLILLTILGSFIVSYTRARAEALVLECKVGLGERAFRLPVVAIGSFFGPTVFVGFLFVLAAVTNATGIYRIWYVWRQTKTK
jgi:CDP-diacylglycerol--glycerol-3-phosphate 3-phosphatidyltransferase